MQWAEQFEIIKEKAWEILAKRKKTPSLAQLDELLEITRGKSRAWDKGQRPSADDLEKIARVLGFAPSWLLLREGAPFAKEQTPTRDKKHPETELGKQLAEIEAALRRVGASDEEIRKAMIAHVGAGKRLEDQDAAQQEPAKASTATS
jgi:phage repressor protein C with HTH and peptisase S24 domain